MKISKELLEQHRKNIEEMQKRDDETLQREADRMRTSDEIENVELQKRVTELEAALKLLTEEDGICAEMCGDAVTRYCIYCGASAEGNREPLIHDTDCALIAARQALATAAVAARKKLKLTKPPVKKATAPEHTVKISGSMVRPTWRLAPDDDDDGTAT